MDFKFKFFSKIFILLICISVMNLNSKNFNLSTSLITRASRVQCGFFLKKKYVFLFYIYNFLF